MPTCIELMMYIFLPRDSVTDYYAGVHTLTVIMPSRCNILMLDLLCASAVMYSVLTVVRTGMILLNAIFSGDGLKSVMMIQKHPTGLLQTLR